MSTPRALALCLLLSACTETLTVVDESLQPVAGAEVWADCTLLGTTGPDGRLPYSTLAPGTVLSARALVGTGATPKAGHDGWSWHAWITTVQMKDDGTMSDARVGADGSLPLLVVSKDNTMIGLNLVGVSDLDLPRTLADDILASWRTGSAYLFDVTDGQMYVERFTLLEQTETTGDADVVYRNETWPSVPGGPYGPSTFTQRGKAMAMPVRGFNGNRDELGTWPTQAGLRTNIHELVHYVGDAHDEYHYASNTDFHDSSCVEGLVATDGPTQASVMDYQYATSELCHDDNHNTDTTHHLWAGRSVWSQFDLRWESDDWNIVTPMDRGAANPGPTAQHCMAATAVEAVLDDSQPCNLVPLFVYAPDGSPAVGADVLLHQDGRVKPQGKVPAGGRLAVVGARPGDVISATQNVVSSGALLLRDGAVTVGVTCQGSVWLDERPVFIPAVIPEFHPWDPVFRLRVEDPRRGLPDVRLRLGQDGDANENSGVWDGQTGQWVIEAPIDLEGPARFDVALSTTGAEVPLVVTTFEATPLVAPGHEQDDGRVVVGLTDRLVVAVDPRTVDADAALVTGVVPAPGPAPEGTLFLGGPWALGGPEDTPLAARLTPDLAASCGLAPRSVSVVRWDGAAWQVVSRTDGADAGWAELTPGTWALVGEVPLDQVACD